MPQVSEVFSQRTWPGVNPKGLPGGDLDDCWVLSAIQAANVNAPWLVLPSATTFRKLAADPDDGVRDGGNVAEIVKGSRACWPSIASLITGYRGVEFTALLRLAAEHRPLSLCVISAKLPSALRFRTDVPHQITAFQKRDGSVIVANPLAPDHSNWISTTWADLRPSILAYSTTGKHAYFVAYPTETEALRQHPALSRVTTALTAEQLAQATRTGWNGAIVTALDMVDRFAAEIDGARKA